MDTREHMSLLCEFLGLVGIPAEVQPLDETEYRIMIERDAFHRRRAYIEAWFTPVDTGEEYILLKERLRGTGNTDF
ncbi:MAG: hypothetical protein IAE80_26610 [Anaerolinea sp.]|nr:hypothetical protein [Anaerolinea sp.]